MPDILAETVVSLSSGPKHLPEVDGKRLHPSTMFRWAERGVVSASGERVRLETARIGSRVVTSIEALDRFTSALSARTEAALA